MPLRAITGRPCPNCGCEDSQLLHRYERWGMVREKRICANCDTEFNAAPVVRGAAPPKKRMDGEARNKTEE